MSGEDIFSEMWSRIESELWNEAHDEVVAEAGNLVNSISKNPTGNLATGFELNSSGLVATLSNYQVSDDGFEYFSSWFDGRSEVNPQTKQSLHWDNVFSQFSSAFNGYGDDFMSQLESNIAPILDNAVQTILDGV